MTSQDQKQFLKDLEETISEKFGVSKFQVRIMFQALRAQKPSYQVVRLLENKSNEFVEGYEDEDEEEDSDPQFCLELEVYDTLQKKKMFLEIYFLNDPSIPQQRILQRQVQIVQTIPHTHLVMSPINSYVLNPLIYYSEDEEFFVVEYDMFDLTLKEFCSEFEIEESEVEEYIIKQANICEDMSQIKVDRDNLFNHFFVYINQNSEQVDIKLNLINFVEDSEAEIRTYSGLNSLNGLFSQHQKKKMSDDQELEEINREGGIQSEQKRAIAWRYTLRLRENNFAELAERDTFVDKENLLEQLQLLAPAEMLSFHDPAIFDIVLKDLNYSQLSLNLLDQHHFIFQITKADEKVCYLEGKKIQSLEECYQLEQQYSSMISSNSVMDEIDSEKLTTISKVRLIKLSDTNYLLIENQTRISRFNDEYETLDKYMNIDKESNCDEEEFKIILRALSKLFEVSNQLLENHKIKITSINPNNIIVKLGKNKLDEGNQFETSLLITSLDNGDFIEEYVTIVKNTFKIVYQFEIDIFIQKVVKLFFESISRYDFEIVQETYLKVKNTISKLKEVKQLEKSLQNQYKNIKTELHLVDDSDQLKKVHAKITISNGVELKDIYQLLKDNQFHQIYFDVTRSQLFPEYDITEAENKSSSSEFQSLLSSIQDSQKQQKIDQMFNLKQKKPEMRQLLKTMYAEFQKKCNLKKDNISSSLSNTEIDFQLDNSITNSGLFSNANHYDLDFQNQPSKDETTGLEGGLFQRKTFSHHNGSISNSDLFLNVAPLNQNQSNKNLFSQENTIFSNPNESEPNKATSLFISNVVDNADHSSLQTGQPEQNNLPLDQNSPGTLKTNLFSNNNNIFGNMNINTKSLQNENIQTTDLFSNKNNLFGWLSNSKTEVQQQQSTNEAALNFNTNPFQNEDILKNDLFSNKTNLSENLNHYETTKIQQEQITNEIPLNDNTKSLQKEDIQTTDLFSKKNNLFGDLNNSKTGEQQQQSSNEAPLNLNTEYLQNEDIQTNDLFSNKANLFENLNNCETTTIQQEQITNEVSLNDNTKSLQKEDIQTTDLFSNKNNIFGNLNNSATEAQQKYEQQQKANEEALSFDTKSLQSEDIQLIQEFFSSSPQINVKAFVESLDSFLSGYKLKLFVQIQPYALLESFDFQYTDKKQFSKSKDEVDRVIYCFQCLSLTFAEPLKNKPIVIKFVLTMNSYVAIESESPLISTYQNPKGGRKQIEQLFTSAYRFADLKAVFGEKFTLQQCCLYQKQASIMFKLFENQKQLSVLHLNLENKLLALCCRKFDNIQHGYFQNLLQISFSCRNNTFQDDRFSKELTSFYFRYLRSLLSKFKKVNSVDFDLKTIGKQREIKLRDEMYKLKYLVSLKLKLD